MATSSEQSLIVVGAGISGLSFAWYAARSGMRPLVLEAGPRVGGCLDSRRSEEGIWFELGAHTLYNSYLHVLEIAEACKSPPRIVPRGEFRKRFGFLRDGELATMGPLSVFGQFRFFQLASRAPIGLFRSKQGKTTAEHFSRIVGPDNYRKVLAPFLSAVPSQSVDEFPAVGPGSLFKKRPRRKDVIKSFTFDGGTGELARAIANEVDVQVDSPVTAIEGTDSGGYIVVVGDRQFTCDRLALAVDPQVGARLLAAAHPELAAALGRITTVSVDTVGTVVERSATGLQELAFVVPADDIFWSVVTRDPVPDERWRAFTFHFKPGHDRESQRKRIAEVLGLDLAALPPLLTRRTVLPAPCRGHAAIVAELDCLLAGHPLALTGNYFDGLAIEDCVARSKRECERLAQRSESAAVSATA